MVAAAHLLFGIAANHAFVDGNKRVALKATGVFLMLNGLVLDGEDADVFNLVMDVAEGRLVVLQIAERLRPMVFEMDLPDE